MATTLHRRRSLFERLANRLLRKTGFKVVERNRWYAITVAEQPTTLIDIGCAYDTPAFRRAFPAAKLFLIDPIREYAPHMESQIARLGGAYAITAVGSKAGKVQITVNLDDLEKSSIYDRTPLAAKEGRTEQRTVIVTPLDELVRQYGIQPPFGVKIDTEGNELEVIKGAQDTIKNSLFVIMEVSVQERFVGSYRFAELIAAMDAVGFTVGNILSAEPDHHDLVRFLDILFIPSGKS